MSNTKIGTILTKLLADQNLRVSELARRINLAQPTIQRIAAGVCEHPHISSLKPIADFFEITVDQLKGLEPIPKFDKIAKLPLITWQEAAYCNKKILTKAQEHIVTDVLVGEHAYALKIIDGAMEPVFPFGTVLIADPTVESKDKSYVIALLNGSNTAIFRQLIVNGGDKHLKPLSPDSSIYKMAKLKKTDNILATVVQARWNYMG